MKRILWLSALLAVSMSTGCRGEKEDVAIPELPVSRVVMYQSGIGYIERSATIDGDELVLRIRPDQINDILKSLTVIDRGKGRPVSISLPVDRDTLDRLAQIPSQVKEGGIRSLLSAFRGANVKIATRGKSYTGRIVGIDELEQNHELSINMVENRDGATVTLKSENDKLDVIAIRDIKSVELFDKTLSDGLDKSLNISLNEGSWKQIELKIRLDSKSKHDLALSYLVAMPTWKPAYRLILGDEDKGTLQGWAVVSNVTGADWRDISFSLVSGQPMSFTYDLYTPQFLNRPDLTKLGVKEAAAPVVVGSARAAQASAFGGNAKRNAKAMAARVQAFEQDAAVEVEEASSNAMMFDAITAEEMEVGFSEIVETSPLGAFDEYRLESKLTIPDGNTALVNLIQNVFPARDVRMLDAMDMDFGDFYKNWELRKSYQTVELKNEGDVALDAGPITIYRDSAVIGEGYLSRTEVGSTAYITFAAEGRISAKIEDVTRDETIRLESFQNGSCDYTQLGHVTQHFQFESQVKTPVTAILRMKKNSTWTPVDFPANVVANDHSWLISVPLSQENSSATLRLTMKKERLIQDSTEAPYCLKAVQKAVEEGVVSSEFNRFVEVNRRLETIDIQKRSLKNRRQTLSQEQSELTSTLAGLKEIKNAEAEQMRKTLLTRMGQIEKNMVDVTSELYQLDGEISRLHLEVAQLNQTLHYTRQSR